MKHGDGTTAPARRHRWWGHAPELYVLFPVLGLFILALIWGGMLYLVGVERAAAQHAAMVFSHELAETYEAQVVRALREIDQALKVVKFAHEREPVGQAGVLQELKARALLPPELLFSISIADTQGRVVAATRPATAGALAGQAVFERLRSADELFIDRPLPGRSAGEWTLRFSRRLQTAEGAFAGVVVIEVDAAYFVSGYDAPRMGAHGLLGILGTDGVFRARRSGDTVVAGELADHAALVAAAGAADNPAVQLSSAVDGVRRYTSVRQLYDFPLTVVVGLSEDEQLAPARREMGTHVWQAVIGSVLVILVMAVLGRLSWQLSLSRRRAAEEQIAHAERVEYLAYHDGLTTLPNRSLFNKLLHQNIEQARRHDTRLSVLFLDLDRFKYINDTLGHEAGDQLLREVANRLKGCLRASDTVARLGGDEFVALLPESGETQGAAVVAQKILAAVARPFVLLEQEFRITVSIGISSFPQDGQDEQTLTKNADIAMYQAKAGGKNNYRFYSQALNTNTLERLNLESGLRHALERGEFQLHYQAKQDIRSGRITGMEALLRWQHPDLGTVAPMDFIPLAEESGLIVLIGKWVLRTACKQNVTWQRQGLPRLKMAINLSARQFADDTLLADVKEILADTGMDASLLELEISESLLMSKYDRTLGVLQGLKDLGVQIAIDDFGSGYSSLARLRQFPLDTIKIDRSFIRELVGSDQDHELTRTIIAVGKSLSLTVVAQGVETKGQADYLRDNACDELQGFYLNRPMQADQVLELLRKVPGAAGPAGAPTESA